MKRLLCLIGILGCFCGTPKAAELQLFPLRLTLTPEMPISAFRLSNMGDDPARLQLTIRKWDQGEEGDEYQQTADVIGNPPLFSVTVKGTQTVRIGLGKAAAGPVEQCYRAFFQEIPSATRKNAAVETLLQISVPIFIPPEHPLPPRLNFKLGMVGNNPVISISNDGNQHVQLLKLTLTSADGKAISTTSMSFYVLPGRTQIWKAQSKGPWPDKIHIEAETDQGPFTAEISGHNAVATASR
jgi:fimbrial chaperone protein